jgi:peroxiredoxin Q/BCP
MSVFTRRRAMFALAAFGAGASSGTAAPRVGEEAPDFSLPSTAGGAARLSDYRGKSTVVLAFFPKAFTGG